jgi:hypothetical protein
MSILKDIGGFSNSFESLRIRSISSSGGSTIQQQLDTLENFNRNEAEETEAVDALVGDVGNIEGIEVVEDEEEGREGGEKEKDS